MSDATVKRTTEPGDDEALDRHTLEEMDEAATTGEHWKILFTSGMGFFTDAYDLFIIGVVVSMVGTEWHLASWQTSLVSSLALLTSAIGAVVFGRIADRLGRKRIYGWEVLVLAAGAIASAFSPNIWFLLIFRAILGFGIGGDYPVSATIMSEYASKKNRGRMVSLVFAMQGAGLVIGPAIAIGLLATGMSSDLAWRLMLGLGAIPALSVFYLRRTIKETPRFRLAQIEAKEKENEAKAAGKPLGMRGILADRRILRWLIGASLCWLVFDIAYYGNTIASPLAAKEVAPHASQIGQISITLLIFACAAVPGYIIAAFTIDHLGRKWMQTGGFILMAVAFGLLWLVPGATTTVGLFVVFFGATYFFAEWGPNTTTFVYPAEIFPVRVRTTSHGIAAAAGKIGGFIGTYALTTLVPSIGFASTSGIIAAVCIVGAVLTVFLLPEPKGKSLEALSEEPRVPGTAVALGLATSRGIRPPHA